MTAALIVRPPAGCGPTSTGGDNPPVAAGGRLPVDGSMAWARAWFSDRIKRGALVEVNGRPAHILSASRGLLFVRDWRSQRRLAVRPFEVSFPT